MDQSDYKLLAVLQQNARTSIQELADHIGASTASVQRRLKVLRDDGVIQKEVAVLDQKKLGFGITAVVSVELERDRLDQIDAFKRKARQDRQVMNFYCIAGDGDFVMIVVAKDIRDYEAFTHRFFFADNNVIKFLTSFVISTEKATLEFPI
jgi:Lrp/AsnC family leucine-responsive transcriptional regulator